VGTGKGVVREGEEDERDIDREKEQGGGTHHNRRTMRSDHRRCHPASCCTDGRICTASVTTRATGGDGVRRVNMPFVHTHTTSAWTSAWAFLGNVVHEGTKCTHTQTEQIGAIQGVLSE